MTRKAEEKSLEPEEVAAAVVEALTSPSPRARSVLFEQIFNFSYMC